MLMDNQWIETLGRDDVEVVPRAVVGFEEGLMVDSEGAKHPADVVVFATGFHTHRLLAPMDIRGRSGATIREACGEEDASAYLGITVPGFPNLFLVGGPHTFLGHGGSALYVAECAITYIKELLVKLVEGGIAAVEPRSDVTEEYNRRIDEEHARLIWTHPGVENWFRNAAGRVVSTIPWRGVDYWEPKEPQVEDFVVATPLRDAVVLDR